jgi:hypothetical protein
VQRVLSGRQSRAPRHVEPGRPGHGGQSQSHPLQCSSSEGVLKWITPRQTCTSTDRDADAKLAQAPWPGCPVVWGVADCLRCRLIL